MKSYDDIGASIIEKLNADPSNTTFAHRVLLAPALLLANPHYHEQAIVRAFFENVSKDLIDALKSSRAGWSLLDKFIQLLPVDAYGSKAIRKRLGDVFSNIENQKYDTIKAEDFPDDDKVCMDLVLFNLEVLIGKGRRDETVALANQHRKAAVAKAETKAAKLPDDDPSRKNRSKSRAGGSTVKISTRLQNLGSFDMSVRRRATQAALARP